MSDSDVIIRHQDQRAAGNRGFSGFRSTLLRRVCAAGARAWNAGRAGDAFQDMSDHLLKDIGLERIGSDRVVRRSRLQGSRP